MIPRFVDGLDLKGKKVLARFDFNVPLKKEAVADTTRIDEALQTIRHIIASGGKPVMMSHLGRPKGVRRPEYSLEPVASVLASKLECPVALTESCLDTGIAAMINLPETKAVLLENLRFHEEEEKNDHEFARSLSRYGDIYVNDAFGACHRKHASTYGVAAFFKDKAGGFLIKREMEAFAKVTGRPERPFVALLGGAKVKDKIGIIEPLLRNVDHLLIGGAMAYPFLKALGHGVGRSLCDKSDTALAQRILAGRGKEKIRLPQDHMASDSPDSKVQAVGQVDIGDGLMGLDIGPQTLGDYGAILKTAKTVLWNGPMGLFENPSFAEGTLKVAALLASLDGAFTVVGGGDSTRAVKESGFAHRIDHISTGGGASLTLIEQGSLPGIRALMAI